jgi:hypothetical protein
LGVVSVKHQNVKKPPPRLPGFASSALQEQTGG